MKTVMTVALLAVAACVSNGGLSEAEWRTVERQRDEMAIELERAAHEERARKDAEWHKSLDVQNGMTTNQRRLAARQPAATSNDLPPADVDDEKWAPLEKEIREWEKLRDDRLRNLVYEDHLLTDFIEKHRRLMDMDEANVDNDETKILRVQVKRLRESLSWHRKRVLIAPRMVQLLLPYLDTDSPPTGQRLRSLVDDLEERAYKEHVDAEASGSE